MDRRVELTGFLLAVLGWICTIVTWQIPMWYVTGTVDNNTDTLALYWNGVWLNWQDLSKGSLHCNFYMSLLSLADHFRSRRALVISSMAIGTLPVLIYLTGLLKFPQLVLIKATAGLVYVISGLLLLIVVSWTTHITQGSLDIDIQLTTEWGPALFSGWIGTVLLLVGGGILPKHCQYYAKMNSFVRKIQEHCLFDSLK
uniref:Claudin n=1 Tax=Astyanax mexicanus TaxID=7994 RepID=A0A8B9I1F0_ASTMX